MCSPTSHLCSFRGPNRNSRIAQRFPAKCSTSKKIPSRRVSSRTRFDFIIATDVLHATADLRETLSNAKKLLAPGGLLIINELNCPLRWINFVFGLIKGWWRFTDTDLRPSHPTLKQPQWLKLLNDCGFAEPLAVSDLDNEDSSGHVVFLSRAKELTEDVLAQTDVSAPDKSETVASSQSRAIGGHWLLFADQGGTASRIATFLQNQGATTTTIEAADHFDDLQAGRAQVDPSNPDHFDQWLQAHNSNGSSSLAGIVYCWGLDCPSIAETTVDSLQRGEELSCHGLMHLVQSLSRHAPELALPLWSITNAALPVGKNIKAFNVSQSPLIGLMRSRRHRTSEPALSNDRSWPRYLGR